MSADETALYALAVRMFHLRRDKSMILISRVTAMGLNDGRGNIAKLEGG